MRILAIPLVVLGCLSLTGCTSNTSAETAAAVAPSSTKTTRIATASIAPVPAADVGASSVAPQPEALAWNGSLPQPHAFDGMATTVGMPLPTERPIATLRPSMPDLIEPMTRNTGRTQIYGHRFRDGKPRRRLHPHHEDRQPEGR